MLAFLFIGFFGDLRRKKLMAKNTPSGNLVVHSLDVLIAAKNLLTKLITVLTAGSECSGVNEYTRIQRISEPPGSNYIKMVIKNNFGYLIYFI